VTDKTKASFIPPMLLVRTDKLPEGEDWLYELKLDGYRSVAFKTGGKVYLRSRNNKDFNASYPGIVKALAGMPNETVIDGEVVALNEAGLISRHSHPLQEVKKSWISMQPLECRRVVH